MKPKKCPICSETFEPFRPLQKCCSAGCAIQWGKKKSEKDAEKTAKASRIAHRQAIKAAKPKGEVMREAQASFNAWIRARDEISGLPCISCGSRIRNSWDAGHYRSRSVTPALRFHPDNVHRQCVQCNQHQHGNLIDFRIGLIKRIGIERVEWLEGPHPPAKYTIQELQEIKAKYRELKRKMEAAC